jgi:basic membrane lipoprotein Med (substrate-binding protein (PBP1-ABC) superfamily)
VLTSALERADVAVAAAVRAARAGQLAGGTNVFFDARNGGITLGRWSPRVGAAIRRAVAAQFVLLRAGKIPGIPTTVQ